MDTNKEDLITIQVFRVHDKICLLEEAIKNIPGISSITEVESLVSNLIDSFAVNDETNILRYSNSLSYIIKNSKIFDIIIQFSEAIGKDIPLSLTVYNGEASMKYINYIYNNNNLLFLPLF